MKPVSTRGIRCLLAAALLSSTASASETITYTYDVHGRLVRVSRSGTINNGVSASYSFDAADNRTNVTVSGAAVPDLAINDASVAEGGGLSFTVRRSGSTVGAVSVNYATANSSAVAGHDYTAIAGTLTFAAGETSRTISVATVDDGAVENTETLLVNLSAPTGGAVLADAQGTGSITDNDVAPPPPGVGVSFSVSSNGPVTEGASSVFTVNKTGTASGTLTVNYYTDNGTATASGDFAAASGTLTFSQAQNSQTISVATVDDIEVESAESFSMSLTSPSGGATLSNANVQATLNDNEPPPNRRPNAVTDAITIKCNSGTGYNLLANDSDPDGDPLTLSSVQSNGGFSISIGEATRGIATISAPSTKGSFSGSYVVSDGRGGSTTGYITVTVTTGGPYC